jgi:hypothetical protein
MTFFETFMSSFSGYRSTEGLAQFPPDQRFRVWRAAHGRLKAKDPAYRARCRRHIVKILVAGVAVALMFQIAFWLREAREAGVIPPEFRTVGRIIFVWVPIAVFSAYLLIVMIRHTKWLNAKVAEEIKKRPTGD